MFYASSRRSPALPQASDDDAMAPLVGRNRAPVFRLTERDIWPGCREIMIEGELDLAVGDEFRAALDRAAGEGLDVLVDLGECDFIDASGVTVLVEADKVMVARDRQLLLCGVHGQVRRILSLTGLDGAKNGATAPLRQAVRDQASARSRDVGSAA